MREDAICPVKMPEFLSKSLYLVHSWVRVKLLYIQRSCVVSE
jgi:hypothetical protein